MYTRILRRGVLAIAVCLAIWATGGQVLYGQAGDLAVAPKEAQPVNKVYIVGYALVVLMVGLGVLVICHYRERKERPDLPKEMLAERLRQGMKTPPVQKAG